MKTTLQNHYLDTEQFSYLTQFRAQHCISIFLPTHGSGDEVLHQRDARRLDVALREIHHRLTAFGLSETEINAQLRSFYDLKGDAQFWREQDLGLALFGTSDRLIPIKLPYAPQQQHRISNAFYLLPLAPFLAEDANFYLLTIELERIRLFQGNRSGINEIDIRGYIPQKLEDSVGYELTGRDLQYRSQHQAYAQAGYHGHDGADRDRKVEILKYFQDVNRGLLPLLQAQPAPLILATQKYLSGLYRQTCTFDQMESVTLSCNLASCGNDELHQMAWEQLQPVFRRKSEEKWQKFNQFLGSGRASVQPIEIFTGLASGRVDTLFVNPELDFNGVFDTRSGQLVVEDAETGELPSAVSEAIVQTIGQGGSISVCETAFLNRQDAVMGALFRY